jgi:FixJ family two-component response regulator
MLEGLTPKVHKPSCKIRKILESLEPKDQEILKNALANLAWTSVALARELTARGISVSEKTISWHRKGGCSCAR